MVTAVFAYLGTELVGVTVGELSYDVSYRLYQSLANTNALHRRGTEPKEEHSPCYQVDLLGKF